MRTWLKRRWRRFWLRRETMATVLEWQNGVMTTHRRGCSSDGDRQWWEMHHQFYNRQFAALRPDAPAVRACAILWRGQTYWCVPDPTPQERLLVAAVLAEQMGEA